MALGWSVHGGSFVDQEQRSLRRVLGMEMWLDVETRWSQQNTTFNSIMKIPDGLAREYSPSFHLTIIVLVLHTLSSLPMI